MIFVKSFTQARFQPIWKFTPITRKPRHVLPPKTPYKSKQMCDSPTVLLRYALSLLYNIKLIKNYTKIFKITQDMSSPAEILPNIEIIYTSAACDACDKYHVCPRHISPINMQSLQKFSNICKSVCLSDFKVSLIVFPLMHYWSQYQFSAMLIITISSRTSSLLNLISSSRLPMIKVFLFLGIIWRLCL